MKRMIIVLILVAIISMVSTGVEARQPKLTVMIVGNGGDTKEMRVYLDKRTTTSMSATSLYNMVMTDSVKDHPDDLDAVLRIDLIATRVDSARAGGFGVNLWGFQIGGASARVSIELKATAVVETPSGEILWPRSSENATVFSGREAASANMFSTNFFYTTGAQSEYGTAMESLASQITAAVSTGWHPEIANIPNEDTPASLRHSGFQSSLSGQLMSLPIASGQIQLTVTPDEHAAMGFNVLIKKGRAVAEINITDMRNVGNGLIQCQAQLLRGRCPNGQYKIIPLELP